MGYKMVGGVGWNRRPDFPSGGHDLTQGQPLLRRETCDATIMVDRGK